MGGDNDLPAAVAHLFVCAASAHGLRSFSANNFIDPGVHINCFIHGILGFLHNQSGAFGTDVSKPYAVSKAAARYLPVACIMATCNATECDLAPAIHLLSGIVPFLVDVTAKPNPHLGNLCITLNIIAMCYYAFKNKSDYFWFTPLSAVLAYFIAPADKATEKILFPIGLALLCHCTDRFVRGSLAGGVAPGPPRR